MEFRINSLVEERPIVPLKTGQVRLSEDKKSIILVTREAYQHFKIVYLKTVTSENLIYAEVTTQKDLETYEEQYPIVADSTTLLINIK